MQGSNKGNLVKEGDIQQESNNRDLSVGIVVLNYNCAIDTISVAALMQDYPFVSEVQIVDNCSTDNSISEIRKAIYSGALGDKVQFAVAASNQGYAAGNNYGVHLLLSHGSLDVVVISNPDIFISKEDWTRSVHCLLETKSAAVAPVMYINGHNSKLKAWKLPTKTTNMLDAIIPLSALVGGFTKYHDSYYIESNPIVDALPGSLIFFDPGVFCQIGGFDEDTFLYCEEDLIFAKLKKSGFCCRLCGEATYDHRHNVSIGKKFASIFKRYTLLLESKKIYNKKVLKTSTFYDVIYSSVFLVNVILMVLVLNAKRLIKNK